MISVCVTTYNGEKYIKEQLDSILCQLESDDEVIVSDDGSTDKTLEIINSYNDDRIKLLHHKKDEHHKEYSFYKISKNVENAINHATGELVFLADQDDVWEKNKVSTVKHKMGNALLLLHDCSLINEHGETTHTSYFELNNSRSGVLRNLIKCSYLGCCMVLNKALLNKAFPFPQEPVPHDLWFGLVADWQNSTTVIHDTLIRYRRHQANQSSTSKKSEAKKAYKIKYRVFIFKALIKRFVLKSKK